MRWSHVVPALPCTTLPPWPCLVPVMPPEPNAALDTIADATASTQIRNDRLALVAMHSLLAVEKVVSEPMRLSAKRPSLARGKSRGLGSGLWAWVRWVRISSIRNRSVRSALKWMEAFRLSTSWELMAGWASTRRTAARLSAASRSRTAMKLS